MHHVQSKSHSLFTEVDYQIQQWQITGSEDDYYSMPEWLRPTAAQLVTAHPIWMDTMPWYFLILLALFLKFAEFLLGPNPEIGCVEI